MKPNWKDAPEWANWLAMDEDGTWCWYERMPRSNFQSNKWQSGSRKMLAGNTSVWHESLEKGP